MEFLIILDLIKYNKECEYFLTIFLQISDHSYNEQRNTNHHTLHTTFDELMKLLLNIFYFRKLF